MAWLEVDGHAALFDTDQRINAVHQAIVDRLAVHAVVFFVTKFGVVRGITFRITKCSRVTHPECRNPAQDKELQDFLHSDEEMLSSYITFDFLAKRFEPWDTSSNVLM